MSAPLLRIATRKSPLALWQAQHIADALSRHHKNLQIELVKMTTSGDRFLKDKLLAVGGKGLFVKELEEALFSHQADLAVHSMKDVPNTCPPGLMIAAISARENPYDALVSQTYSSIHALPPNATVATSSLRRQSQLLAVRPDLRIVALRGNIHTRLEKLEREGYDAIVLAVAGLKRMGLEKRIQQIIPEAIMLPACGQGALGLECRVEDPWVRSLIKPLNDHTTATCVQTERHVNALLGGNCHVPVAIYAQCVDDLTITLKARVASADGSTILTSVQQGCTDQAQQLAQHCAEDLIAQGAYKLIQMNQT